VAIECGGLRKRYFGKYIVASLLTDSRSTAIETRFGTWCCAMFNFHFRVILESPHNTTVKIAQLANDDIHVKALTFV
jgi:hypothetical protein